MGSSWETRSGWFLRAALGGVSGVVGGGGREGTVCRLHGSGSVLRWGRPRELRLGGLEAAWTGGWGGAGGLTVVDGV